ncbi:MAG: DNA-directed RNA polymerase subunit E' [Candidatus Woesearchaeota archaeon]|nr:DNA-directed RNA polymerase subunit E' [Candidatus Woesearchaeota archaeon]
MFYRTQIKDHIRVPPNLFGDKVEDAVLEMVKKEYEGHISKQIGIVIDASKVIDIGQGTIVPGDGASYYETTFEIITFKPELQEVVHGKVKDIADFGAFLNIGPIEGMIHISQTMDDFVSFSKEKSLQGKESKKSLKIGDKCVARVIAVSYKDISNPKIGLTMRQPGLGRQDWIYEEEEK